MALERYLRFRGEHTTRRLLIGRKGQTLQSIQYLLNVLYGTRLDRRIAGWARKHGFTYTRYADDLTFSWHGAEATQIGALLRAVKMIVRAEGFEIHTKKTRVMRSGARQQPVP